MLAQLTSIVHNALCEEGSEKPTQEFIPDYTLSEEQRKRKKGQRLRNKMKVEKLRRELTEE